MRKAYKLNDKIEKKSYDLIYIKYDCGFCVVVDNATKIICRTYKEAEKWLACTIHSKLN